MPEGRAHRIVLRRLLAPRLAHGRTPADLGLAADTVRLPVPAGHDPGDALGPHAVAIAGFVRRALAGP